MFLFKPLLLKILLTFLLVSSIRLISAQSVTYGERSKIDIVVFLALDCPISQKYVPRLNGIYQDYKGIPVLRWEFVVAAKVNRQQLNRFVREYHVEFPLISDSRKLKKARKLKASATPEVVIVCDTVLYRGSVDNWYYAFGQYSRVTTEHYLRDAIESILRNEKPKFQKTALIGCPIFYNQK